MDVSLELSNKIAFELKMCYMQIYLDEKISQTDNWFIHAMTNAVLAGNTELRNKFSANPNMAYMANEDKTICDTFLSDIRHFLQDAANWVYEYHQAFGYSIDTASILLPYILEKIGITYTEVGVFIPLALLIVKIVSDIMVEQRDIPREKKTERAFRKMLTKNIELMNHIEVNSIEAKEALDEAIKANEKMLELMKEK